MFPVFLFGSFESEVVVHDDRLYFYCCGCCQSALRENAVRSEGLYGIFCTEACALNCYRVNNIPIPGVMNQMQMGDGKESVSDQADSRERKPLQMDDLRPFPKWD